MPIYIVDYLQNFQEFVPKYAELDQINTFMRPHGYTHGAKFYIFVIYHNDGV